MWKEEKEERRIGGLRASSTLLDEEKLIPNKEFCMGT